MLGFSRGLPATEPGCRPNFLFILVDDMGWADLNCYGSTFYETPNVDRIAAGGVRFTSGYAACPVCSPTRASIMTGKYPARIGLTNWLSGRIKKRLVGAPYIKQMPLEEVTIAEALKEAGYVTGFVGKWHLGGKPFYPEKQGFDVNVAGCHAGSPMGGYFAPWNNPKLRAGRKGEYLTDVLTDAGVAFIESNKDRLFFLYQSYHTVHTPIQAKPGYVEKYRAKAAGLLPHRGPEFLPEGCTHTRQVQRHPVYAGMMQSMDENVGRLLDALDRLSLADNTVVVFMSDNGGLATTAAPTSNLPLRAGKGWLYEGGIREPFIIRWPGVTRPGSVCHEPVTSTDFYPTMLEMAGLPPKPAQHRDGVSLVPLLKEATSLDREALYWHYPHYSPQGGCPSSAVRQGDYKLIEFFEDGHVELYNLARDIGEKHDLVEKLPEKTKQLHAMLKTWRRQVGAKLPAPNPDYSR